jgi:hypothetical protein
MHKTPLMTHNDERLKDSASTQKLEWVTPKIALMDAGDTDSGKIYNPKEFFQKFYPSGPS